VTDNCKTKIRYLQNRSLGWRKCVQRIWKKERNGCKRI